jgi:hypothetical protein
MLVTGIERGWGAPVANSQQANSPKWRWLFKTDHLLVYRNISCERARTALAEAEPWILIVYILIVVIGEAAVVATGLALDRIFPLARLPVSLSLFFAVLAFGWPLAVRWTEPKHAKKRKTRKLNLRGVN